MKKELDEAFNLTATYRRDSDVIRRFGDIESLITDMNITMVYDTVMSQKQPYGKPMDQDNSGVKKLSQTSTNEVILSAKI